MTSGDLRNYMELAEQRRIEIERLQSEQGEEVERIREIILRGWDDHMWNFENMAVEDEQWLLRWAGHPSAEQEREDVT